MRKKCSIRVRSRGKFVLNGYTRKVKHFAYIQDSEKWENWTSRTISYRQAQLLLAAGEAQPVSRMLNGAVQIVGYRATQPTSWEQPSPTTLTMGTMNAVAKDSTGERLTRREREHVVKFRVWPLVGDSKAVAVRPPMTPIERHFAEQILRHGYRRSKAA